MSWKRDRAGHTFAGLVTVRKWRDTPCGLLVRNGKGAESCGFVTSMLVWPKTQSTSQPFSHQLLVHNCMRTELARGHTSHASTPPCHGRTSAVRDPTDLLPSYLISSSNTRQTLNKERESKQTTSVPLQTENLTIYPDHRSLGWTLWIRYLCNESHMCIPFLTFTSCAVGLVDHCKSKREVVRNTDSGILQNPRRPSRVAQRQKSLRCDKRHVLPNERPCSRPSEQ